MWCRTRFAIVHCDANAWNFALSGDPSTSKTALADASSWKRSPWVPLPISKLTVWPAVSVNPFGSGAPFISHVGFPLKIAPWMVIVRGGP